MAFAPVERHILEVQIQEERLAEGLPEEGLAESLVVVPFQAPCPEDHHSQLDLVAVEQAGQTGAGVNQDASDEEEVAESH